VISVFDLFSIGIGPSSSHTVGPMRAALRFVERLATDRQLAEVAQVRCELFGSLGATGHGHGSPAAVLLGLAGERPGDGRHRGGAGVVAAVREGGRLRLGAGGPEVDFDMDEHLVLHRRRTLPLHPNGMLFQARSATGELLAERTYYSVGGGFVLDDPAGAPARIVPDEHRALPFRTAADLLLHCADTGLPVSGVMLANELAVRPEAEVRDGLLRIWRGCRPAWRGAASAAA